MYCTGISYNGKRRVAATVLTVASNIVYTLYPTDKMGTKQYFLPRGMFSYIYYLGGPAAAAGRGSPRGAISLQL